MTTARSRGPASPSSWAARQAMGQEIQLARRDSVTTVTLNRPEQRNAISYAMWLELADVFRQLDGDPETRVVVLRGAGEAAFSAGADIKDFEAHRSDGAKARQYSAAAEGAMQALAACSRPTIAMIQGYCVGGGCELALFADMRVAATGSKFGIPAARLGIVLGHREVRRLVALVGLGAAMHMLLIARTMSADEALRIGLVDAVVPVAELEGHTYALAEEIAGLAPLSHAGHKRVLASVLKDPSLAGLSAEERDAPFRAFDSEDYREGVRAFLEKRKPRFRGG
ncbi:MAG: enoyl-CoA hydratase-related protein [Chloroflexota bacterium]|nr:enoyl-CoA hydratase-related protein [Chloroflexota bacterium]